jgi:hypothetical protein
MTESLDYTYTDLISLTIEKFKTYYKNIDKWDTALSKTDVGSYETQWQWQAKCNKHSFSTYRNADASGTRADRYYPESWWYDRVAKSYTTKMSWKRSTTNNTPISYSANIQSSLEAKTKSVCGITNLSTKVTAKGLLAYLQLVSWVIKKGTTFMQPVPGGTNEYPCFTMPTLSSYAGPTKKDGDKDVILKDDFGSIVINIASLALINQLRLDTLTFSMPVSCSSSSCSSSSSSSSCSSSSSSSSCSSSSSSWFVAFMKLI